MPKFNVIEVLGPVCITQSRNGFAIRYRGNMAVIETASTREDIYEAYEDLRVARAEDAAESDGIPPITTGCCDSCYGKVGNRDHFCRTCGKELNQRIYPCPRCDTPNEITRYQQLKGYVCDSCADARERGGWDRYNY